MTPDQRAMAIWGGIGATAVIGGWLALSSSIFDPSEPAQRATALHGEYEQLYSPAEKPSGLLDARQAVEQAKAAAERQRQEHAAAVQQLAPPLPREYLEAAAEDLKAQALLQSVSDDLAKRCEQAKIAVPAWPITQFDSDPGTRSRQLATVYGYARLFKLCLDAGVRGLGAPVVGEPRTDPGGTVARFPYAFACVASWEVADRLVHALRDAHQSGFGLTDLTIDMQADGSRKVSFSASLLLASRPEWKLAKLDAPKAPAPGAIRAVAQPVQPVNSGAGQNPRPTSTSGAERL